MVGGAAWREAFQTEAETLRSGSTQSQLNLMTCILVVRALELEGGEEGTEKSWGVSGLEGEETTLALETMRELSLQAKAALQRLQAARYSRRLQCYSAVVRTAGTAAAAARPSSARPPRTAKPTRQPRSPPCDRQQLCDAGLLLAHQPVQGQAELLPARANRLHQLLRLQPTRGEPDLLNYSKFKSSW